MPPWSENKHPRRPIDAANPTVVGKRTSGAQTAGTKPTVVGKRTPAAQAAGTKPTLVGKRTSTALRSRANPTLVGKRTRGRARRHDPAFLHTGRASAAAGLSDG